MVCGGNRETQDYNGDSFSILSSRSQPYRNDYAQAFNEPAETIVENSLAKSPYE